MADEERPETQRLSLLDEDGEIQEKTEPPPQKRRGFWQRFSRNKSADDDDKEVDALLGSGLDNYNDYDDSAPLDGSQRSRLTRSSVDNENSSCDDDDEGDGEDDGGYDYDAQPHSDRAGTHEYDSLNFLLLPSGDDDDDDDDDDEGVVNNYRSAPNLQFNSDMVHYDDDDESSGSGDSDLSEKLSPMSAGRTLVQRSFSMSSGFNDHRNNEDSFIDPNGRKQLVGRIEGFGNSALMPDIVSSGSFRERIRSFTLRRGMKKMAIGYDDNSASWSESLRIVDIVDAVLPAPMVLEGYIDKSEKELPPSKTPAAEKCATVTRLGSFRRQEFESDETYILFLECELQNTELELGSWKSRVKELEAQVARLRGDDSDDDSSKSDAFAEDDAESEIEWQSEPVVEGVLIDVDGTENTTTSDKSGSGDLGESTGNEAGQSEIESQTEPLKEGVLIDVEDAEESVSHNIVCEEDPNPGNVSVRVIADDEESNGDGEESDDDEDSDDSVVAEQDEPTAVGILIDIGGSENPVQSSQDGDDNVRNNIAENTVGSENPEPEVKEGLLVEIDGNAPSPQNIADQADGSGMANLLGLPGVPTVVDETELNSVTQSASTADPKNDEDSDDEGSLGSASDSSPEESDGADEDEDDEDDGSENGMWEVKEGILIDIHDHNGDHANSPSNTPKESLMSVVTDDEGQQSTSDEDDSDLIVEKGAVSTEVPEGNLLDLTETAQPAIGVSG
jgi:hypothetical protein